MTPGRQDSREFSNSRLFLGAGGGSRAKKIPPAGAGGGGREKGCLMPNQTGRESSSIRRSRSLRKPEQPNLVGFGVLDPEIKVTRHHLS